MGRRRIDLSMGGLGRMDGFLRRLSVPMLVLFYLGLASVPAALIVGGLRTRPGPPASALRAPPCPETTPEAIAASGMKADRTFQFDGVGYALRQGEAACNLTRPRGRRDPNKFVVCQFSAPVLLVVTTPNQTRAFNLKTKSATVWFEDGQVRCAADSDLNVGRALAARR